MTFKRNVSIAIVLFYICGAAPWIGAQDISSKSVGRELDDEALIAEKQITESLSKLSDEDRKLAIAQRFCASMEYQRLGTMGTPLKLVLDGKPVFICCKGCGNDAKANPKETLTKVEKLKKVSAELSKLPPKERRKIESQKYCAIAQGSFLGSMGAPIKLDFDGKLVYLCCEGCIANAKANPKKTLARVDELRRAGLDNDDAHDHE